MADLQDLGVDDDPMQAPGMELEEEDEEEEEKERRESGNKVMLLKTFY